MPDAIHLEENPSTILKAGDTYDEKTSYKFEVIKILEKNLEIFKYTNFFRLKTR